MQLDALLIEARFQTAAPMSSCLRMNQAERVMRSSGGGVALTRRPASILDYRPEDFELTGYDPHPHIAAPVSV